LAQSLSLPEPHPSGQQASLLAHELIAVELQLVWQLEAPTTVSLVHGRPSLQVLGQLAGGSQLSPASMTELPQIAGQSLSLFLFQPEAQQPSLCLHPSAVKVHFTLQLAEVPLRVSVVQTLLSFQVDGQLPGGSHVSMCSTIE
jgi:hypothetical protein